jgi:hypothetical protein
MLLSKELAHSSLYVVCTRYTRSTASPGASCLGNLVVIQALPQFRELYRGHLGRYDERKC